MPKYKLNLTRRVTVRFTDEQFKELEAIAIQEQYNVSEVVRTLTLAFLRHRQKFSPMSGARP